MKQALNFLTADIGTSSLKAAVIDAEGRLKSFARIRYPHGVVTAETWENAFKEAVRGLLKNNFVISAVCISANGPSFVPLDKNKNALLPIHWHDAICGSDKNLKSLFLPYVINYAKKRKNDFEKTAKLISCQEWLMRGLGAEEVTVLPNERYIPYYWDKEQCEAAEIDMELFPRFIKLGETAGKTNNAFLDCGIPKNIPIIAGGSDFIMALIGTGTLSKGLVLDRAGTSEGINFCAPAPAPKNAPLRTLPHAAESFFNIGALIPKSGILFDNYRQETNEENRDYAEHLNALLKEDSVENKKTAGKEILLKIALAVKEKITLLKENGFLFDEMRVSGGQAKNALWNKLKAEITGITLAVPEIPDGELAGNACLCAAASGEFKNWTEAASKIVRIKNYFRP